MRTDRKSSQDSENKDVKMPGLIEAPRIRTLRKAASSSQTTIFLLGAGGQLGHALQQLWSSEEYLSNTCLVQPRHEAIDIGDRAAIQQKIKQTKPDVVINCAAYTDREQADGDRDRCWMTNVAGVENIVRACLETKSAFFHLSCDSVFGADVMRLARLRHAYKRRNLGFTDEEIPDVSYKEGDAPGPVDYFGVSKLSAEHLILQAAADEPDFKPKCWIIRTGCMFEVPWRRGTNFPYVTALRLKQDQVPVPTDVFTSICYVPQLAAAIAWMVANRAEWSSNGPLCPSGIYHVANRGAVSLYDLAVRIGGKLGSQPNVAPVKLADYAKRFSRPWQSQPANFTVLNTQKYEETTGPQLDTWADAIDTWCEEVPKNI
jgi:dTDP-4-dehydrorhamnose reductase